MNNTKIGFLGLGAIGFPMCYHLSEKYTLNLPVYRRAVDQANGFSDIAPDAPTKSARIDEMLAANAIPCASQKELIENSDIICISMPKSAHVEMLMNGKEGILANAKPDTLVIDLTSGEAAITQKLCKQLEAINCDMVDACVSGGVLAAGKGTLTIMAGGSDKAFQKALPVLQVIGNPENITHCGPSGAGDIIKCANNFISALDLIATTEALELCVKAGIDPVTACRVFASSGGKNDANMRKFPQKTFKGIKNNFAISLMLKDVGLFTDAARTYRTPSFTADLTYQLFHTVMMKTGASADMSEIIKWYDDLCGQKLFGAEVQ